MKKKLIVVFDKNKAFVSQTINRLLSRKFKVKSLIDKSANVFDLLTRDFFVFTTDEPKKLESLGDLLKAEICAVVVNEVDDLKTVSQFLGVLSTANLLYNADVPAVREMVKGSTLKKQAFGFSPDADFKASDMNENMSFKINYRGSTVPIWQKGDPYSTIAAVCLSTALGLNFVEISGILKSS